MFGLKTRSSHLQAFYIMTAMIKFVKFTGRHLEWCPVRSFFFFLFLKVIRHGNSNKVFHFKSCFYQNWQLVTVYSAYLYSILISKLAGVTQKICYEKSLKVNRKTRTIALFLVKIKGFFYTPLCDCFPKLSMNLHLPFIRLICKWSRHSYFFRCSHPEVLCKLTFLNHKTLGKRSPFRKTFTIGAFVGNLAALFELLFCGIPVNNRLT